MSTNKKDNSFIHEQEIITDKFEVISFVVDEDIVKDGDLFYEEPDEEYDTYEEFKNYLYFKDEDPGNGLPSNHVLNSNDGSGTIVLRAPTKFSWGVILGGLTIAFNIIVSGTALYFYQTNLNEKMDTRLSSLETKVDRFEDNVYSKREGDLIHENMKLELSKQGETITKLEERYGR